MAKKQSNAVVGDVLGAANPDVELTAHDGQTIQAFINNLVPFFKGARIIERAAASTLDRARALTLPTDAASDETIQLFIKQTTVDKKAAETYWSITAVVHGIHKRLVAHRQKPVAALDEANAIANTLHNRYTEAERRRVAIEQDRLRRDAEAQARIDRERDLAAQEEAALQHELLLENLSEREQHFVSLVVSGHSPTAAARGAGYKGQPDAVGERLATTAKIATAIEAKRASIAIRTQADAIREQPLEVRVEKVRPQISRAAGVTERTTWAGEIVDEAALIEACLSGKHGIPRDILRVDPVKLNDYARSLHERLDLWPGARAVKTTKAS